MPAIVARTVEIDDPGALLSLLPETLSPERVSTWIRRGEGLVGWGRATEFRAGGVDRFAAAQAWWKSVVERAVGWSKLARRFSAIRVFYAVRKP